MICQECFKRPMPKAVGGSLEFRKIGCFGRRAKVTPFSKQANSLILVPEPTWTIGRRDENRSSKGAASNVTGAEIAGRRTAVSFRPATKGGCVARATPGLDRRSHPSGRSPDFLVCPKLTCF